MTPAARLALAALALAGCGAADPPPEPDPALVNALVEVHLADARAALDSSAAGRWAVADSLRRGALAAHGLDADALDARQRALAADPDLAKATYAAVEQRLTMERRGMTVPDSL